MEQDFIIENGVLKKYTGEDSIVVIPEGVTSIGEFAFSKSKHEFKEDNILTNITIPETVTRLSLIHI